MFLLASNGGLQAVANAIRNVIDFLQTLISFIANIFRSLILALGYLIQLIPKIMTLIATLPSWLLTFATITVGVSVAYFIIGRSGGKTE